MRIAGMVSAGLICGLGFLWNCSGGDSMEEPIEVEEGEIVEEESTAEAGYEEESASEETAAVESYEPSIDVENELSTTNEVAVTEPLEAPLPSEMEDPMVSDTLTETSVENGGNYLTTTEPMDTTMDSMASGEALEAAVPTYTNEAYGSEASDSYASGETMAASPAASSNMGRYIVQPGDSLSAIAQKIYGNAGRWGDLASYNNINDPARIFPGDEIQYDLNDSAASSFASRYASESKNSVTVQRGDTLSSISSRVLGSQNFWRVLYSFNKDKIRDPNMIFPGQILEYVGSYNPPAMVSEPPAAEPAYTETATETTTATEAAPPVEAMPTQEMQETELTEEVLEEEVTPEVEPVSESAGEELPDTTVEEVVEEDVPVPTEVSDEALSKELEQLEEIEE